ncbi:MAG: LLM class flavin-dependent oxidoreductase, partial [Chromatiales bacterium]|nr:LLM class flavin-dependent oxidoreductase [Chromatiales bacterium]
MERRNAPLSQLYEERLQLLEVADRAGFWGYHKAEHHFIDLDAAPSSNLFLAAASQRTSNIRFGPLVYLLPFYHPLRLIEEVCALDHLCGGRLEIGVGKGISPPEHRLWGLDPERARSQFEEGFRILREGLASERIDFVGEHYQFHDTPSPMVPHEGRVPAFWYPGNVAYAGRYRLNTVASGPVSSLAQASKDYRRAVDAADENWNHTVEHP